MESWLLVDKAANLHYLDQCCRCAGGQVPQDWAATAQQDVVAKHEDEGPGGECWAHMVKDWMPSVIAITCSIRPQWPLPMEYEAALLDWSTGALCCWQSLQVCLQAPTHKILHAHNLHTQLNWSQTEQLCTQAPSCAHLSSAFTWLCLCMVQHQPVLRADCWDSQDFV